MHLLVFTRINCSVVQQGTYNILLSVCCMFLQGRLVVKGLCVVPYDVRKDLVMSIGFLYVQWGVDWIC
jgi:hypothetical protein